VVRVINHSKNPVAARQRTLKTEVMGFCAGKLAQVKTSSTKYREPQNSGFLQYGGARRNWLLKRSRTLGERTISGISGQLLV
jgi:hypothetical protein